MQQYFITGNQFQSHMWTKFNLDINSASANMSNVRGKEKLVYEYVRDIASLFQPMRYGLQDNPMGLYSDYESFKKHFVRYWKNALDISRADLDEVRIFLMMFYPLRRVAKIELLHQCFLKTVKHLQ